MEISDSDEKIKQKAVAVTYELEEFAPKIAASGKGAVAEKIIETAKANGIPIVEDEALVEILSRFDLNTIIPPELYQVVAEVLAYVYRIDGSMKGKFANRV